MRDLHKLILAIIICALPISALAEEVRLMTKDGNLAVEGEYLGYDGRFYRVNTVYGTLTLDGTRLTCEGSACPDTENFVPEIRISGAPRMADILLPALIQSYAFRRGYALEISQVDDATKLFQLQEGSDLFAKIMLRSSGTSEGFADLIAEEADIALVLRAPRPEEIALAKRSGAGSLTNGRRAHVVALDGLVIATSPEQNISEIATADLPKLFSGDVTSWTELGGKGDEIRLLLPPESDGIAENFHDRFLAANDLTFSPSARQVSPKEFTTTVIEDPASIGLTSLNDLETAKALSLRGACGLTQTPSLANLRSEDYPLTVPLMLYTPSRRLPAVARDFLDYAESSEADLVVLRAGFVDQGITRSTFGALGTRLAHAISQVGEQIKLQDLKRLVTTLKQYQRLSSTFRFRNGSSELDIASRENINRLSRAIRLGAFGDRKLILAGFSDGEGDPESNTALSKQRAETVAQILRTSINQDIKLQIEAFGEAFPLACDDTEWGRATNRRVEVWVE